MSQPQNTPVRGLAPPRWRAAAPGLGADELRLFERLYRGHFDFVFRCLHRAGVPESAVDDAVQDVFLVVFQRLSDYRRGSNPKAWLFAIVLRVASNHRRWYRRKGGLAELPGTQATTDPGPFEHVAQADDVQLLHTFLQGLPEEQRNVFVMADLEQMTAREIVGVLGINLNTVYSRLRVARARLAKILSEHKAREQ